MSMRISPPLKVVIVALSAGAWLTQADASVARTIAFAAGATFAWIMFGRPRPAASAPAPAGARGCSRHRHGQVQHRISRTPCGRGARDVRCRASRATARARRSTRR
jgi:hypothetical protein